VDAMIDVVSPGIEALGPKKTIQTPAPNLSPAQIIVFYKYYPQVALMKKWPTDSCRVELTTRLY